MPLGVTSSTAALTPVHEITMKEATTTVPRAGTEIKFTERQIKNFWRKVDKDGPLPDQTNPHYAGLGQCWVWTGCVANHGYGMLRIGIKGMAAHRVAWMTANGTIPQGSCICHKCDTPLCTRVDHMFLGTNKMNAEDRENKGRGNQPSGDASGARLHPERRPWGDRNGSRKHPERRPRGDAHFARRHSDRMLRGEGHGMAKLTVDLILEMRARHAAGETHMKSLGEKFGVSRTLARYITTRKLWAHIPEEWV